MFDDYIFSDVKEDTEFMPLMSITEEEETESGDYPEELPLLALKNTVLFPGIVIPITIGRDKSIKAVNAAYKGDRFISVFSQIQMEDEDPETTDLYQVGTVARILKLLKMPDGSTTAILQGRRRCKINYVTSQEPFIKVALHYLTHQEATEKKEFEAMISSIKDQAKEIIDLSSQIPNEAVMMLKNIQNESFLLNFIASNMSSDVETKQDILETDDLHEKAKKILKGIKEELQLLELKQQIEGKVKTDIERQQRDYFLNQQLKTIQEELGQNPQEEEIKKLEERAKKKKWPEKAQQHFERELSKVRRINPQVAEYSVQLNYLELMLDLPWDEVSKDNFNLKRVKKILDQDHYGLEKVKERILEHLAVLKLKGDLKAPILCLVGPPGVGKTSLGKSIARALNRSFVRMSLGGLHDESEIRGHRKTYIGAMPGRILQSVKKAKTGNPVFILDEIDKLGKDFRGDPSSALLEVLDPEQNTTFYDNYLELEYDLSKVLFIATANSLSSIQPALLDRMEIIEIAGYSMEEKVEIAKKHLVPKQVEAHGLKKSQARLGNAALKKIIQEHTRESGVRELDRKIAAVMRHISKKVAMEEEYKKSISAGDVKDILGPRKYNKEIYTQTQVPGVAVGLAWTRFGGDILFIESSAMKGKGKLTLTGNLGDVMKESASTALTFIKAHADKLDLDESSFEKQDIHIHVPEGAIPKDGPSAGVTMLVSLASILKKKPVKSYMAMTGEITLRGKVLPVGGIKEKVLAARRAGLKTLLLCKDNQKDVDQIDEQYLEGLDFIYVDRMEEVLHHTLGLWEF
ncbi:MAG: endopeptidase La [Saprospiraceae bacterium]|nr:endopeptidase La [Saprospiraceae bacterium]